jgi:hypothetical protein
MRPSRTGLTCRSRPRRELPGGMPAPLPGQGGRMRVPVLLQEQLPREKPPPRLHPRHQVPRHQGSGCPAPEVLVNGVNASSDGALRSRMIRSVSDILGRHRSCPAFLRRGEISGSPSGRSSMVSGRSGMERPDVSPFGSGAGTARADAVPSSSRSSSRPVSTRHPRARGTDRSRPGQGGAVQRARPSPPGKNGGGAGDGSLGFYADGIVQHRVDLLQLVRVGLLLCCEDRSQRFNRAD